MSGLASDSPSPCVSGGSCAGTTFFDSLGASVEAGPFLLWLWPIPRLSSGRRTPQTSLLPLVARLSKCGDSSPPKLQDQQVDLQEHSKSGFWSNRKSKANRSPGSQEATISAMAHSLLEPNSMSKKVNETGRHNFRGRSSIFMNIRS